MKTLVLLGDAVLTFAYILPELQGGNVFYATGAVILALAITLAVLMAR